MIPAWLTESTDIRVLGYPMNQNRLAVPAWSYAMEKLPPMRIVELGSYNGGFIICLGLHAKLIGCRVYSWDVCKCPTEGWGVIAEFLNVKFFQADVFANEAAVARLITMPGCTYLLCDNGNKIQEFNTFAKYLKPGDVIGGHDYATEYWKAGSEINVESVAASVAEHKLQRWMPEVFDLAGWLVYRKA